MNTPFSTLCLLLAVGIPAGTALHQDPQPAGRTVRVQDRSGFVMEAGQHDLRDVIDRAAAFLDRNIMVGAQEMPNNPDLTVEFQERLEVDAPGCEELLSGLLYTRGLVLVPVDVTKDLYEVISMSGGRQREIPMRAQRMKADAVLARRHRYQMVLTTVELQHVNAQVATNTLRPFFAASGHGPGNLSVSSVNRNMILSGLAPQVAGAIELLREVDVPNPAQETFGDRIRKLEQRIAALEAGKEKEDG